MLTARKPRKMGLSLNKTWNFRLTSIRTGSNIYPTHQEFKPHKMHHTSTRWNRYNHSKMNFYSKTNRSTHLTHWPPNRKTLCAHSISMGMSAATNHININLHPANRKEVGTSKKRSSSTTTNFLHKLTQHLTIILYFRQIIKLYIIRHLSSHT